MSEASILQYNDIESALALLNIGMSPAEMHGLMAGWLCVKSVDEKDWKEKMFEDAQVSQQIEGIFYFTGTQLESTGFDFQLCLPEDESSLHERAAALAQWCHGFLSGFGLTGFDIKENAEVSEAIKDISEITKLDEAEVNENDDYENMFFEVEEFVRMAVLLIYTEIQGKRTMHGDKGTIH